jgi:hypothetical protein
MAKQKIEVRGIPVRMKSEHGSDYICISDIAKSAKKSAAKDIIKNWLRNRNTLQYLGYWESLHNDHFNRVEFDAFFSEAGLNSFAISPTEWIRQTNAIGIITKAGRGGGTYAHYDIATHFCLHFNVQFHLYFVREFRRLKTREASLELKTWDLRRELTKASYEVHTDAIREHLVPVMDWHSDREKPQFATEADLLNQAVFGMSAREFKQWKPNFKGNLRDWASEEELKVVDSLQSINATLIEMGFSQGERFQIIWRRARRELHIYENSKAFQRIKDKNLPDKFEP